LTGHVHPLRRIFVIEALKIRQADCLELVDLEYDLGKL
jgi:hypothetical protein